MTDEQHDSGFVVVPAVDVLDNRAVRLERGDFDRVATDGGHPLAVIARAARDRPPFIHVVALDAARDGGVPITLARTAAAVAAPTPVQLGGGVRTVSDATALADAGVARVLVGTAGHGAVPLEDFVVALGDRLVVAVDVAEGSVRTAGWLGDSGLSPAEALARCCAAGVTRVLCTAISRDGTLSGPDLPLIRQAREAFNGELLAAGGIRHEEDLAALRESGADGAVVGRAWLEGKLRISS
jgi:phosphoribosylformimino-5-aminoimidazole carboxamide ribotide isomerase